MNWQCANSVGTDGFFKGWTEVPQSPFIFFEDAAISHCSRIVGLLLVIGKYHLGRLGAPLAKDKILWSVPELRRLSLLDTNITNITLIQNNKKQVANRFTFSPVQIYPICNWGGLTKISSWPLLSSVNFAQNFWNLSHETVPSRKIERTRLNIGWGGTTWTGDLKCKEVKTGFFRKR